MRSVLSFTLPARPEAVAAARHTLQGLTAYLPEDVLADVELLASELITNSVRHADLTPDDVVELFVEVGGGCVRVVVVDPGGGLPQRQPAVAGRTGGYGLNLVDQLSSRWGIDRRSGTKVWFETDLERTTA